MKRLLHILILVFVISYPGVAILYAETSVASSVSAKVGSASSVETYKDANVLFESNLPFTQLDPTSEYNYPDGRRENDGKSDIGFVIISNTNETWYVKIRAVDVTGDLAGSGRLYAYMGQPTDRNTNGNSEGTLTMPKDWFKIPTTDITLYTSAGSDNNNVPFGTLITLSFRVDGTGLKPGPYVTSIAYTMTTNP